MIISLYQNLNIIIAKKNWFVC